MGEWTKVVEVFALYGGLIACIFFAGFGLAACIYRPKRNKRGLFVKQDGSYETKRKTGISVTTPLSKDY